MCNTFDVEIISKMCKLLKLLKSFENCFDFKNTKTLFEPENKNYIIDLIFDAKLLYKSFYIFFKSELDENYLLKNLILNCI